MKTLLIIIVFLTVSIWSQAQDTVKYYFQDTLIYYRIDKGDTAYHYKAETNALIYVVVDKGDDDFQSWNVVNGIKKPMFRVVKIKGITADGFCHGIKADGNRCTRAVKVGIIYCWQHD